MHSTLLASARRCGGEHPTDICLREELRRRGLQPAEAPSLQRPEQAGLLQLCDRLDWHAALSFRLLDPRYRFTRATGERIGTLAAAAAWAGDRGLDVPRLELATVALLADQPADVGVAALRRLGWSGEPLARAVRALETTRGLAARLEATPAGAVRAGLLRSRRGVELAALWLEGRPSARAAVEWWVDTARRVHPLLRGEDVVELGVRRGPAVAEVLDHLRDLRLDGAHGNRETEIEYVRHWLAARKEG